MLQPLRSIAWQQGHKRTRCRGACAAVLAACILSACATDPAARRATTIADADHAARAALENENRLDPKSLPAHTFAVLPFTTTAGDTLLAPLGYGLASFLITDLSASPDLHMVERLQTDAILREL